MINLLKNYNKKQTFLQEEDNEELYCRTCDQWFHNLHNKREHLQGKQHLQSVAGDITRELASEAEGIATTSTMSLNTSLDESSLDGMPNKTKSDGKNPIYEAMRNLATMVSSKFCFIYEKFYYYQFGLFNIFIFI